MCIHLIASCPTSGCGWQTAAGALKWNLRMPRCLGDGNRVEAYCFAGFSIVENIQVQCEHADGNRSITLIKFHGQNVVARQRHAIRYNG
jgi:hypothetical protein